MTPRLCIADVVLMICTPEITSVKNTARFLASGYSDKKLKVVVNHPSSHGAILLDDIQPNLRHKMSFGLPNDGVPVVEALDAREIGRLSCQLARELALPGQEPAPSQGSSCEAVSLFGRLRGPKVAAAR